MHIIISIWFCAISNTIKDSYLGLPYFNHLENLSKNRKSQEDNADKITDEVWKTVSENNKLNYLKNNAKKIVGTFKDNWFGDVIISEKNGKFYFQSVRSKRLLGELFYYKDNTITVKWNIRSFHADAFVFLDIDSNGNINHLTMKAISPITDFSYDFHDLDFIRSN